MAQPKMDIRSWPHQASPAESWWHLLITAHSSTILFVILPALVIIYVYIIRKLTSPRIAHPISLRKIRSTHDMQLTVQGKEQQRPPSRLTRPPSRNTAVACNIAQDNPHEGRWANDMQLTAQGKEQHRPPSRLARPPSRNTAVACNIAQDNPRGGPGPGPSSYSSAVNNSHSQPSQPRAYPQLPASSKARGHHNYSSQGHSRGHHRDADPLVSSKRLFLQSVARDTVSAINIGAVVAPDPQTEGKRLKYSIRNQTARMQANTLYFPPDAKVLCNWSKKERSGWKRPAVGQLGLGAGMGGPQKTRVSILPTSTLDGARYLHSDIQSSPEFSKKVGVLNFASATSPGGGFINGAQAQEESIARSSNLYVSLTTPTADPFYALHAREDKGGYYSHAMIYTPDVLVFRDDAGAWILPYPIDVVTSPAVNAGQVRKLRRSSKAEVEARILEVMRERMARILALFENRGTKHLVLGSFGTGVFQNDVKALAGIWAELLMVPGGRFGKSFESVVFTIPDEVTRRKFESGFGARWREGGEA